VPSVSRLYGVEAKVDGTYMRKEEERVVDAVAVAGGSVSVVAHHYYLPL
jgi:hypothetical protein